MATVEEAPLDGDAYARKSGGWVETYPKTRMDEFVAEVLAAADDAENLAGVAATKATTATNQAAIATNARQAAETASNEAASQALKAKGLVDQAEADYNTVVEKVQAAEAAATRAEAAADSLLEPMADHLAAENPHPQYLKAPASDGKLYGMKDGVWTIVEVTGGGGTSTATQYQYKQLSASTTWIIPHNLSKRPCIFVEDAYGNEVVGEIKHDASLQVSRVYFDKAITGVAYYS